MVHVFGKKKTMFEFVIRYVSPVVSLDIQTRPRSLEIHVLMELVVVLCSTIIDTAHTMCVLICFACGNRLYSSTLYSVAKQNIQKIFFGFVKSIQLFKKEIAPQFGGSHNS